MAQDDHEWMACWLDRVRDGSSTMSQRSVTSIEVYGGLDLAVREARERGVHLVQTIDERGSQLVAASRHPFHALC